MRALIRSLAPTTLRGRVARVVALYRPGPMAQNWHNEYADRKNGRKPVVYDHPDLEEILAPTYGLMIYQEQLMRVRADARGLLARRGRQPPQGDRQEDPRPDREGARRSSSTAAYATATAPSSANEMLRHDRAVRRLLVQKSHTVGYGFITYQTAWLKANYPVQYLAALLTSVKTNLDKAAVYLNECRQLEIPVLVPDVNASAERLLLRVR